MRNRQNIFTRQSKLRQLIIEKQIDALIIAKPQNLAYIFGYSGGEGVGLFTNNQVLLFVDERIFEWAKTAAAVEVVKAREPWKDVVVQLNSSNVKRLTIEPNFLTTDRFQFLSRQWRGHLVTNEEPIEQLRRVKDIEEIRSIQKACKIVDETYQDIIKLLKIGISEQMVANQLEFRMRKLGADRAAFPTIVAFGVNSAIPHYQTSTTKLGEGMIVLLDFGAQVEGYCSDITRSFIFGKPSDEQKKIWNTVAEARHRALSLIRPGVSGKNVDRAARSVINHFYPGAMIHNTGHGVGLEIHEYPKLGRQSADLLKENMVVTIEPGIYLPGVGGVRLEDTVVVTKDGYESLTRIAYVPTIGS